MFNTRTGGKSPPTSSKQHRKELRHHQANNPRHIIQPLGVVEGDIRGGVIEGMRGEGPMGEVEVNEGCWRERVWVIWGVRGGRVPGKWGRRPNWTMGGGEVEG